jgi:ribosome maturation factor RimP
MLAVPRSPTATPRSARPVRDGQAARPVRSARATAPAPASAGAPEIVGLAAPETHARRGDVIERTVTGLGYELVDVERVGSGLLRITIDRVAGRAYATGASPSITIDDCETVTHQLQFALEVDNVNYARLEVSSPGLDRPIKRAADLPRFVGQGVDLTLREPLQGRKRFRGVLRALGQAWRLELDDALGKKLDTRQRVKVAKALAKGAAHADTVTTLDFEWHEVREMRLVPVVDFKGRSAAAPHAAADGDPVAVAPPDDLPGDSQP